MQVKHGLATDRVTILISAGGFGVGPIKNTVSALTQLQHPAQVVALCGRNEDAINQVESIAGRGGTDPRVLIKAVGFTTEVDEYMAASDILLGKPGGLTTSEALARGLVFVIVNPIPGQEERNSDHLLEEGVAIRCNNLPALAFKIDRLLDDEERLAAMKHSVAGLARPRAAYDIIFKLLAIANTSESR
jgi:processive 1,2-diacylglycerol beta-glucosyltransferase